MKLGRRDHHHVVYHKDHGEVFGEGDAPLSLEQILENSLGWCRNTGINVFNFHISSHSRDFLGIDPCENAAPPFEHLGPWTIYETIRYHRENGVDLMAELCRLEGLVLDPVYTGKAFSGMVAEIAAGRFEGCKDIIFLHTGGVFGLFPQRAAMQGALARHTIK